MKNMNNFLTDSSVVELNSVEMNEIVGGSWLSNAFRKLADVCDAIAEFLESL